MSEFDVAMKILFIDAYFDVRDKDNVLDLSEFGEVGHQLLLSGIDGQFVNKELIIKVISFYIDALATNGYLFELEDFFACISYGIPTFYETLNIALYFYYRCAKKIFLDSRST